MTHPSSSSYNTSDIFSSASLNEISLSRDDPFFYKDDDFSRSMLEDAFHLFDDSSLFPPSLDPVPQPKADPIQQPTKSWAQFKAEISHRLPSEPTDEPERIIVRLPARRRIVPPSPARYIDSESDSDDSVKDRDYEPGEEELSSYSGSSSASSRSRKRRRSHSFSLSPEIVAKKTRFDSKEASSSQEHSPRRSVGKGKGKVAAQARPAPPPRNNQLFGDEAQEMVKKIERLQNKVDVPDYKCTACDWVGKEPRGPDYTRHLLTHLNHFRGRTHVCNTCDTTFSRADALKRHQKTQGH